MHQGADAEPEAVEEGEVVLHHVRAGVAGVGVVPLVGAKPWWEDRESSRISERREEEKFSGLYNHTEESVFV